MSKVRAGGWSTVVVTGMGLWTALGASCATNLRRLTAGDTAFAPSRVLDLPGLADRVVAEIARDDEPAWADRARSRAEHFALVAADEAMTAAGLLRAPRRANPGAHEHRAPADDTELIVSVSTGGMFETERIITSLARAAQRGGDDALSVDPLTATEHASLASHAISGVAEALSQHLYPFRRTTTLCSACSGGALAIGLALTRLRTGAATRVLAGGVDSLSRLTVAGFGSLQSLDPVSCRPFAADRRGLVLGEGAGFLVLEREETARARGATIFGRVAGYDVRSEAHHITHPEPSGATAAAVMVNALVDSGLRPADVDYVSAHGTATVLNDKMETSALLATFGDRLPAVAVSSQKGQIGHTLAAAGAVEAIASLLAMNAGVGLPNVMGGPADDSLPARLSLVPAPVERGAIASDAAIALSSSFGFGGTDASLVVTRSDAKRPATTEANAARDVWLVGGHALLDDAADAAGVDASASFSSASALDTSLTELVADRVRRFDRPSRLTTALLGKLIDLVGPIEPERTGLAAGAAYGSSEAAATFFLRVEDKGARFAAPADFPNLVPSSAGANAAIYEQLRGPVFSVADLDRSIFAAIAAATDLLAEGRADTMFATHVESRSLLAERFLAPAHGLGASAKPRGEGAAGVALCAAAQGEPGPSAAIARVVGGGVLRRADLDARALGAFLPAPAAAGCSRLVVLGSRADSDRLNADDVLSRALCDLGWGAASREHPMTFGCGHEAVAALQIVQLLDRVARGEPGRWLVVLPGDTDVAFFALDRP